MVGTGSWRRSRRKLPGRAGSLLCTCIASQTPMCQCLPAQKRSEQTRKFSRPFRDQQPNIYSCDSFCVGAFIAQFFLGAAAATGFQLCYVDAKVSGGKCSASAHADALSLAKKNPTCKFGRATWINSNLCRDVKVLFFLKKFNILVIICVLLGDLPSLSKFLNGNCAQTEHTATSTL